MQPIPTSFSIKPSFYINNAFNSNAGRQSLACPAKVAPDDRKNASVQQFAKDVQRAWSDIDPEYRLALLTPPKEFKPLQVWVGESNASIKKMDPRLAKHEGTQAISFLIFPPASDTASKVSNLILMPRNTIEIDTVAQNNKQLWRKRVLAEEMGHGLDNISGRYDAPKRLMYVASSYPGFRNSVAADFSKLQNHTFSRLEAAVFNQGVPDRSEGPKLDRELFARMLACYMLKIDPMSDKTLHDLETRIVPEPILKANTLADLTPLQQDEMRKFAREFESRYPQEFFAILRRMFGNVDQYIGREIVAKLPKPKS